MAPRKTPATEQGGTGTPHKADIAQNDGKILVAYPDAVHASYRPGDREFAPGVILSQCTWWDEWVGTPTALAASGIIRLDRIPGAEGMPATSMMVTAEGEYMPRKGSGRVRPYRNIRRATPTQLRVRVNLDRATVSAREIADQRDAVDRCTRHLDAGASSRVVPRPRVLPAGWRVIIGGRHA